MSVGTKRDSKGASESKVGEFEVPFFVDQQVLRFEISMEDAMGVTVVDSPDELIRLRMRRIRGRLRVELAEIGRITYEFLRKRV